MVGCIFSASCQKNKTKQALSSGHGHRAQRVKLLSAFNAFLVFNFYASVLCCVTYLQWPVCASGNVGLPGGDVATNCSRRTNSDVDGPDFEFRCVLSRHSRSEYKPINLALAAGRPAPCRAFRAGAGRHRGDSPGRDFRHPAVHPLALQEPCRTWICSEH